MTDMTENSEAVKTETNKGFNPLLGVGVTVMIVVVAFTAFGGKSTYNAASVVTASDFPMASITSESTTNVKGASDSMQLNPGVKTIPVEAGSFYYKPAEIRLKKGDKVKIELKSVDMMHDFNIDELNVKGEFTKAGNTSTVEFTADKSGEFEYYCSVGQHRKLGQVGKLIVE